MLILLAGTPKGNFMEKYGIGNQITNKTSNAWKIKNFSVKKENFKFLVY